MRKRLLMFLQRQKTLKSLPQRKRLHQVKRLLTKRRRRNPHMRNLRLASLNS